MYVWGDSQIYILAIEVTVVLYTYYFTKNKKRIYLITHTFLFPIWLYLHEKERNPKQPYIKTNKTSH